MGKKKKSGLKTYDNMGYLFVLPFVVVFLIFSVYPVFRTLYLSFTNAKIAGVGDVDNALDAGSYIIEIQNEWGSVATIAFKVK